MFKSNKAKRLSYVAAIIIVVLCLYLSSLLNYLLFHSLIEIVTIAIAFAIFVLTWNTYQYSNNNSLKLLGVGYAFIAMVDLLHTLSTKGMVIFTNSGENLSSQLWIAARYLQVITFIVAPIFVARKTQNIIVFGLYTIMTSLLMTLIYFDIFPACYVAGIGQTTFKIYSEYGVSALLLVSFYLFYRERKRFNDTVFILIASSIICMILSEISFTIHVNSYEFINLMGHFLKLASIILIYQAILITNLKEPFNLIFEDFKEAKEISRQFYNTPAEKVRELIAKLRASEARYRSYIELTDKLGWITNPTGEVEADIPSYRKYTGQTYEEVKGRGWTKAIHPDDVTRVLHVLNEAVVSKKQHEIEYRIRRHDGNYRDIVAYGVPVLDKGHRMQEWVYTSIDITKRKHAEEALLESEERFRSTFEQAAVGITHVDPEEGCFIRVNQRFCDIIGYSREELSNLTFIDITHPDDLTINAEFHLQLLTGEIQTYSLEKRYIRKDGELIWVNLTVSLEHDSSGKPKYMITVVEDITGRKKSEEKLRESEIKYRTLVENIPQKIFYKDNNLSYVACNEKFAHDLGITAKEIEGKSDYDYFPKYLADKYRIDDLRIMASRETEELDERYIKEGKERIVHTIKTPVVKYHDVIGIMGVFWDITEQKRNQEQLKQTLQDLERSNSELERFAYVASHDLQEPLRMVTSYLQLLERRYKDNLDDDALEFINYAVDGSIRMKSLINDLLAYSRVGTRGKEFFSTQCETVLKRVLQNLSISIQETKTEITHDILPVVIADETQLEQLFQNLLSNAIKFHSEKPLKIHIGVEENKDEFIFSVRDNGIGINPQYFERIFIIFQRLHNLKEYPGTGIGLAISKRIIDRHGGKIWVESQPGEGSIFYFTLPKRRKNDQSQHESH